MRPFFPVLEQTKEYVLDEIHSVRAYRLIAYLGLKGKSHAPNPVKAMIDTGAPFSVLPYRYWAQGGLELELPPARTLRPMAGGVPGPEVPDELTWLGVRCVMGQLRASLVDEEGRRSRSFTLLAKLPVAPIRPPFERLIILGQHFFAINRLTLLAQPGRPFPLTWSDGGRINVAGWIASPRDDGSPSVAVDHPESLAP